MAKSKNMFDVSQVTLENYMPQYTKVRDIR